MVPTVNMGHKGKETSLDIRKIVVDVQNKGKTQLSTVLMSVQCQDPKEDILSKQTNQKTSFIFANEFAGNNNVFWDNDESKFNIAAMSGSVCKMSWWTE